MQRLPVEANLHHPVIQKQYYRPLTSDFVEFIVPKEVIVRDMFEKLTILKYKYKSKLRSKFKNPDSSLYVITHSKEEGLLLVMTVASIIGFLWIFYCSKPAILSETDFHYWFHSTVIQFNGTILGLLFVFLSLSYILLPQGPLKLLKKMHFQFLAIAVLLLIMVIFLSFLGLYYQRGGFLVLVTFLEIAFIYLLGTFAIEFINKFKNIDKEINRIKTEEFIKGLEIDFNEDTGELLISSKIPVYLKEGIACFELLKFDIAEGVHKLVNSYETKNVIKKTKFIKGKKVPLYKLKEQYLIELKDNPDEYIISGRFIISAIDILAQKHYFALDIELHILQEKIEVQYHCIALYEEDYNIFKTEEIGICNVI